MVNKKILEIQEKYVLEDWQDSQVNLNMLEDLKEEYDNILEDIMSDLVQLNIDKPYYSNEQILEKLTNRLTKRGLL